MTIATQTIINFAMRSGEIIPDSAFDPAISNEVSARFSPNYFADTSCWTIETGFEIHNPTGYTSLKQWIEINE